MSACLRFCSQQLLWLFNVHCLFSHSLSASESASVRAAGGLDSECNSQEQYFVWERLFEIQVQADPLRMRARIRPGHFTWRGQHGNRREGVDLVYHNKTRGVLGIRRRATTKNKKKTKNKEGGNVRYYL